MGASDAWKLRETAPDLASRYREQGLWSDDTLAAVIDGALRSHPGLEFRIWSQDRPFRGSVGEVHERARRLAAGLRGLGIGPGDVVAFQLPSWVEAAITFWGVAFTGATLIPIVHFYGSREVSFIVRQSGARAFITTDRFRSYDYPGIVDTLREQATELEHLIVAGAAPAGTLEFSELADRAPIEALPALDPAAPAIVAYTSGTTAEPKGVIHSHRSILSETRQLGAIQAPGELPMLAGAPVGHFIGMMTGMLLPLERSRPIHLTDVWDPARILDAMLAGNLTAGSGSTYFLTSLLDHPDFGPEHASLMATVGLGGAPVPAAVADRAESLGISIIRSYGCSEQPSITGSAHSDPAHKRKYTDGGPLPGVEIVLVDESGRRVPQGSAGEILSRGPELFAGYTDPALSAGACDADGFFATGDIGVLDEHGWLTITDRKKDIIIRGGENISAGEIEELMARMPGVAEVAVVAAPDERMGEHACAFVRMGAAAATIDLPQLRAHLEAVGLARPKWPEEIRSVDDFPRTPSGKIKKFVLRQALREGR